MRTSAWVSAVVLACVVNVGSASWAAQGGPGDPPVAGQTLATPSVERSSGEDGPDELRAVGPKAFGWLQVESWVGWFTVKQVSTRLERTEGYGSVITTTDRIHKVAFGSVVLEPWDEPGVTSAAWISDDDVAVSYRHHHEQEIVNPDGEILTFKGYGTGEDGRPASARLWIDAAAGTYSVAIAPRDLEVQQSRWMEASPGGYEAACMEPPDPLFAAMAAIHCWVLEHVVRPDPVRTNVPSPGAAVHDLPLPASGSTLSGSRTIGDVEFVWDLRPVPRAGRLEIVEARLLDLDDTALAFLSLSPHDYYGGFTRVHGTITVEGDPGDALDDLVLEVIEGGRVVATGRLASSARARLATEFGPDGRVTLAQPELLFELASHEMAAVDQRRDGTVALRLVATSARGLEAAHHAASVEKLVRYTAANRFGERDVDACLPIELGHPCGGDDWARPSVVAVIEHFSERFAAAHGLRWNDFSNMNGGHFPPHTGAGHRTGVAADGTFRGYADRDAAAAARLIEYLNDPTYGSRIWRVFVTFRPDDDDPFWRAIRDVTLADGRRATAVIRAAPGHTTHFHWDVRPGR